MSIYLKYWLQFIAVCLLSRHSYSQECDFFRLYPDEVKTKSAAFVDSLRRSGVDTILFYGIGIGGSGGMAYAKITWATDAGIHSAEIIRGDYNKKDRKTTDKIFMEMVEHDKYKHRHAHTHTHTVYNQNQLNSSQFPP